ncbi:hypothetical protein SAMN04515618_101124 [Collimonas sp. OK307]|nr:hypothetical protein SAMN04515618_101124 [Collimonas sp. OK307]
MITIFALISLHANLLIALMSTPITYNPEAPDVLIDKELSKDPQLAISKGLSWFDRDRELFRFRGARLLSSTFL